jgi:RND family efflux transporter MFP subunit
VDDTYTRFALENATINHNKYKEDIQRFETLRAGDAVSETQLRDVKIAYESTKVQLEQVSRQLEDTYIRAPFGGYITSKDIELGKFVNISAPIASIADISELKVLLSVTEANVYRLQKGQPVTITTQIYPGVTFAGRIAHISPQGDNAHSYPVEISLPNSTQHPLKAGTYVNVSIDMGSMQRVLSIPRDAIVSSVKDPAVYRIENNIAKLVKITTGKDYENIIEVLQGLDEGDQVVVNGQINLMDGASVIVNY